MRLSRTTAPLLGLAALTALTLAAAPVHAQSYTLTILGSLPGDSYVSGNAVNNAGQVAGNSYLITGGYAQDHAFLSGANGGSFKGLGTFPGDTNSIGTAVNDSG